jgi:hypothetical protein
MIDWKCLDVNYNHVVPNIAKEYIMAKKYGYLKRLNFHLCS